MVYRYTRKNVFKIPGMFPNIPNIERDIAYRKIPIINPWLIFVQEAVFQAYFRRSLFSKGLIIERNLVFQNGLGLTIKTA